MKCQTRKSNHRCNGRDFLHSNLFFAIDTFVSKIIHLPKSTDVSQKFFEEIIVYMIHKQCKNLVRKFQHGYIIGRSSVTKLSVFGNYVSTAPDRRKQIHVIYTDFSKVSQTINHQILAWRLYNFGFRGSITEPTGCAFVITFLR